MWVCDGEENNVGHFEMHCKRKHNWNIITFTFNIPEFLIIKKHKNLGKTLLGSKRQAIFGGVPWRIEHYYTQKVVFVLYSGITKRITLEMGK